MKPDFLGFQLIFLALLWVNMQILGHNSKGATKCTTETDVKRRMATKLPNWKHPTEELLLSDNLQNAIAGNDFCNGEIVITGYGPQGPAIIIGACMCDCLHIDDVAEMMAEKGMGKRPAGK